MRCLLALLVLLTACTATDELSAGPPRTPDETLAALRERTGKLASFYGVVSVAYDGPDRKGTFDAIIHWRRSGELRMTAYKDLLLAAPDVFDLLLGREEWALVSDDHEVKKRGPRAELPGAEPRFAAVHWAGDVMFRPGTLGPEAKVSSEGELQLVRTTIPSGATAIWTVDPRTLAVQAGELICPDERRIHLRFREWKAPAPGLLLPGRVELQDPTGETVMQMRLKDFELDPALEDALFSPDVVLEDE